MHILDLSFADGKRCRCIVMEPTTAEEDAAAVRSMFHAGYLVAVERVMPRPPAKLPWRRDGSGGWVLHGFRLDKLEAGRFRVVWPGGEVEGGKDEVSEAVRANWAHVVGE